MCSASTVVNYVSDLRSFICSINCDNFLNAMHCNQHHNIFTTASEGCGKVMFLQMLCSVIIMSVPAVTVLFQFVVVTLLKKPCSSVTTRLTTAIYLQLNFSFRWVYKWVEIYNCSKHLNRLLNSGYSQIIVVKGVHTASCLAATLLQVKRCPLCASKSETKALSLLINMYYN